MVEAYTFAGTTITVLVPGEVTGGAFTVLHVIKPNGCSTPPHSHDAETEVPYVLSGLLGVETDGRSTVVAAGASVVLPPTRPHRLFNASGAPVREFLLCAPAHFDRFVAAAGALVKPYAQPIAMTDEGRQRLVATAPEFGIRLLSSTALQDRAQVHAPPASTILEVPDARIAVQARLGNSDTDLVLLRGTITPGLSLNLHSQADPGCLFVIDGEVEVVQEGAPGKRKTLGADEAISTRPDTYYAARALGSVPVNLLMVTTARMVHAFATVGSTADGKPAHGGQYGWRVFRGAASTRPCDGNLAYADTVSETAAMQRS